MENKRSQSTDEPEKYKIKVRSIDRQIITESLLQHRIIGNQSCASCRTIWRKTAASSCWEQRPSERAASSPSSSSIGSSPNTRRQWKTFIVRITTSTASSWYWTLSTPLVPITFRPWGDSPSRLEMPLFWYILSTTNRHSRRSQHWENRSWWKRITIGFQSSLLAIKPTFPSLNAKWKGKLWKVSSPSTGKAHTWRRRQRTTWTSTAYSKTSWVRWTPSETSRNKQKEDAFRFLCYLRTNDNINHKSVTVRCREGHIREASSSTIFDINGSIRANNEEVNRRIDSATHIELNVIFERKVIDKD